MSFNLDKGSVEKKKFNLSKAEGTTAVTNASSSEEVAKPFGNRLKVWIALLLIGIAAVWIAVSHNNSGKNEASAADQQSPVTHASDPLPGIQPATQQNSQAGALPVAKPDAEPDNVSNNIQTAHATNERANKKSLIATEFTAGSSQLGQVDASTLSIVSKLKMDSKLRVRINGYASSEGTIEANIKLS